ncbi:MAG: sugar lactone lactonase YvrE, partial [Kiritimatiellia bacterium]
DKSGKRLKKISINALNVMHCTFGGENLDTLFIATDGTGYDPCVSKKQSMHGCILTIKPGVSGLKTNYFSG